MNERKLPSEPEQANREVFTLIDSVADDVDTLLALSDFCVRLSSYVEAHNPAPDYMGIRDTNMLENLIQEALDNFPQEQKRILSDEASMVKQLVTQKQYGDARVFNHQANERVDYLLANSEPPEYVKEVWARLPKD